MNILPRASHVHTVCIVKHFKQMNVRTNNILIIIIGFSQICMVTIILAMSLLNSDPYTPMKY